MAIRLKRYINIMFGIKKRLSNGSKKSIWFLHGFTESSDCFNDVWNIEAFSDADIFIPDFPGFGESAFCGSVDISSIVDFLFENIFRNYNDRPVYIVGHSLGGSIGLKLLKKLLNVNIKSFFLNVDGLILPEKKGGSSLAFSTEFESDLAYKKFIIDYWSARVGNDFFLQRYLQNIQKTPHEVLHAWAKASVFYLANENLEKILVSLKGNLIYFYGAHSINERNYKAALLSGVDCVKILDSGHWPMLEVPENFWKQIVENIKVL